MSTVKVGEKPNAAPVRSVACDGVMGWGRRNGQSVLLAFIAITPQEHASKRSSKQAFKQAREPPPPPPSP